MKFKKIDRTNMSEEIVEYIKTEILSRHLKAGQRLPSEEVLAENMGVGRGTLREALKVLIHIGLVERRNNGTFVSEGKIKPKLMLDKFRDISEMIEVRKVIEPALAGFTAKRAGEETIQKLGEEVDKMKKGIKNIKEFTTHDSRFHDLIFEAAGNTILEEFIKNSHELLKKNQSFVLAERYNDIMPKSMDYHEKIYNAIKLGDEQLAYSYMYEHIADVESEFMKIIEKE